MNNINFQELVKAEGYSLPFKIWEYTPLDRACMRMVIRGTWIFNTSLDVNLIKDALSKVLSYYPHLAGRMKCQEGVTLTNEGVPFETSYEPELTVEDVLKRNDFTNINEFSIKINPARFFKGLEAPLSIKITKLKNGYVLGVQCSHACLDGDSFYTMIYNWGQLCNNQPFNKPLLDQSLLPAPENKTVEEIRAEALEAGWKKISIFSIVKLLPVFASGIMKKRSRPFHISSETIDLLKARLSKTPDTLYSTHVVLSALITKKCMELFNHPENTRCSAVSVVNTRNRLAGVPSNYAGNSSLTLATPSFPVKAGIEEVASIIDQTLKPARQSPSPELMQLMKLNINTMKHKQPFAPFDVFGMHAKKPTIIYLNNFSKLHIYDIDFGSGKPIKVIPHDLLDQVVFWPSPPNKGGMEVYFSGVPNRYIEKLEDSYFNKI